MDGFDWLIWDSDCDPGMQESCMDGSDFLDNSVLEPDLNLPNDDIVTIWLDSFLLIGRFSEWQIAWERTMAQP